MPHQLIVRSPTLRWNKSLLTLFLGRDPIKIMAHRAASQIAILDSFQELGWPQRMDDPLPRQVNLNPKRRLSDTIESLNDRLLMIRFHGDGTGTGIRWSYRPSRPARRLNTGMSPDVRR